MKQLFFTSVVVFVSFRGFTQVSNSLPLTGWTGGGSGGSGVFNVNSLPSGFKNFMAPSGAQASFVSDTPHFRGSTSLSQNAVTASPAMGQLR